MTVFKVLLTRSMRGWKGEGLGERKKDLFEERRVRGEERPWGR